MQSESNAHSESNKGVSFRPASLEDAAFLLEAYASTRSDELAIVPWDEGQKAAFVHSQFTAQQQHYATYFPHAKHDIILLEESPVGRLYVDRQDSAIHIIDILLLPQYRNAGIGTPIIRDLMAEAAQSGKAVRIYVETFNPSLRLFERLGFVVVDEVSYRFLLEWRPGVTD